MFGYKLIKKKEYDRLITRQFTSLVSTITFPEEREECFDREMICNAIINQLKPHLFDRLLLDKTYNPYNCTITYTGVLCLGKGGE